MDAALQLCVVAFSTTTRPYSGRLRDVPRPSGRQPGFLADQASAVYSAVVYDYGNLSNPGGGTAPAAASQGTITAIDPDLDVPVVYTYNFGIQRRTSLGHAAGDYLRGNLGRHLIREPNINEPSFASLVAYEALPSSQRLSTNPLNPYQGYSTIDYYVSDSNSNYNALQVRASRRRGAVLFTVNYTWSHALADTAGNYNSSPT